MIGIIQKYINFYLHKIITKCDWQRYTNSRLFLGEGSKVRMYLLAYALNNMKPGDNYEI